LQVENKNYPIEEGHWYQFKEGVAHNTIDTSGLRLCLGPWNERGRQVGGSSIFYYQDTTEEVLLGQTDYCGTTIYFANYDIIPSSNRPSNSVFVGWKLYRYYLNGNELEYTEGQIIPPGSPNDRYISYFVYPVWRSLQQPLHFSDNSLVYYKPGSLASGGVNTVRNSRHKAKHV
jgi:hypothetical protein